MYGEPSSPTLGIVPFCGAKTAVHRLYGNLMKRSVESIL